MLNRQTKANKITNVDMVSFFSKRINVMQNANEPNRKLLLKYSDDILTMDEKK